MERDERDEIIFYGLINDIQDGVLFLDFSGTVLLINKSGEKILGISSEKLCGKKIANLMGEMEGIDEFLQCMMDSVYEKRKRTELVSLNTDGRDRNLRVVSSVLQRDGENIGIIVMFSDLTTLLELGKKNAELNVRLAGFIERFVRVMIGAIEERTPYNGHHTRSMVKYAEKYFDWMIKQGRSDKESIRSPFVSAVWLHDVGKLVIPRAVMDKATRLGEHEKDVLHRIEVAILYERLMAAKGEKSTEEAEADVSRLEQARELILKVNHTGYLNDELFEKVEALKNMKCYSAEGELIPLLDEYEADAISVRRGTLTASERKIIESHVVHTGEMLEEMEFTDRFSDVSRWGKMHHELLDGSGYPNHLKGDEIPWEARLLTILDIYDSLTADDRPYKPAVPCEKAFGILREMVNEGKIDGEILEDFYRSGAWKTEKKTLDSILKNVKF